MTGQQAGGRGAAARGPSQAPAEGKGALIHLRRRLRHADLTAVPEVRRALRDLLRHREDHLRHREDHEDHEDHRGDRDDRCDRDCTDVAELLTTELVTNALVHTEHDAEVTATVAASRLRVEVRDLAARHPQLHVPIADDGTHGRGLFLVQALADAWGVRVHGVGKVVWFELDLGGGPA
ncbi:ATP-binding protein [Streptomyces altiplanensis]